MHGDFEPLDEYNGDIIRIDRLIKFFQLNIGRGMKQEK